MTATCHPDVRPQTGPFMGPSQTSSETMMRVMLDGDLIRVTAVVDIMSARKLMKALEVNIALLEGHDVLKGHSVPSTLMPNESKK